MVERFLGKEKVAGSNPVKAQKTLIDMTALEELENLMSLREPHEVAIMVDGFTSHRTTLLEELTESEVNILLQIYRPRTIQQRENDLIEELKLKEWRSNILALAEKVGIKKPQSFHEFNNWMLTNSKFKKHLNAHRLEELQLLYRQLQGVKQNNERSSYRPMTKAWWEKGQKLKNYN